MRWMNAVYSPAILPEHQGNPLIEALPSKIGRDAVMDAFAFYPAYSSDDRELDALARDEYLIRLEQLRQPLPIYYECFRSIERAMKVGYSAKDPFSPTTLNYLHYAWDERPTITPQSGAFQPKGCGITLVGESGVGKTSMLEQILHCFPNVIHHSHYHGKEMEFKEQVVWVKVDCPHNASVRELCESILLELDISLHCGITPPGKTIGALIRQIEQRIKTSFLGILVIDEMQNIRISRAGGEDNLLRFLHSLVNNLGIPLCFCANPPFDLTLSKTLKAARRAESGGYFSMEVLGHSDKSWRHFINELWLLQWTNVETPLTDKLSNKIHTLSVGNLDLAHRIYREAQRMVIGTGDERITEVGLEQAYAVACGASSKTAEVIAASQALTLPQRQRSAIGHMDKKPATIVGDITRPQHPEFMQALRTLQQSIDLPICIDDPDRLRRAIQMEDPVVYLAEQGLLYIKSP